jgi:hypothetical protein
MKQIKGKTHIDLYFQSDSYEMYVLLREFEKFEEELGNSIILRPHYVTYPISYSGSDSVDNCFGSGKYCSDPNSNYKVKDGRTIIEENIRQKCVYSYARFTKKNTLVYVNFMNKFFQKCLNNTESAFAGISCHKKILEELEIPSQTIQDCYDNSFEKGGIENFKILEKKIYEKENVILEEESRDRRGSNLDLFPSILVNNVTFLGSWKAENVLEMVCAGFTPDKIPPACFKEGAILEDLIEKPGISFMTIVTIFFVVIILNFIIYLLCRRYVINRVHEKVESNDINDQISSVVSRYMAMRETKL